MDYNEFKKSSMSILSNKKYQWVATVVFFIIILMMSSSIRLSNWNLLTDSTTGEKIPLALDPFYFLRVAETLVNDEGNLPEFDEMRGPGFNIGWHPEVSPEVIVWMWKASSIFGNYTLQAVDAFSPVFFYGIGLTLFFFLTFVLTQSKLAGILASTFLAFNPAYLYRTMAGFSDHEAIGMVGFFGALLCYSLAMRYLDKNKKISFAGAGVLGGVVGLMTALTIAFWGGVSLFLFMIIPISFFFFWIMKVYDEDKNIKNIGILFYICWAVFTIVFGLLLGYNLTILLNKFLSSYGIISLAVFGFIILDWLLIFFDDKIKMKWYDKKYRIFYTIGLLVVTGIFALPFLGKNFFGLVWEILNKLLNPLWGSNRVVTTVAENAQPYLSAWIDTVGHQMFWLFVAGIIFIGFEFSKNIKSVKNRYLLILGFIAMSFGILFSRISSGSILNGAGIFSLSGLVYIGGIVIFVYAFLKNYFDKKIDVSVSVIILFSWMFVMLVIGRSTTRLFFVIATFVCLAAAYFIVGMFDIWRNGKLGESSRVLVAGILIISIIAGGVGLYVSYGAISGQAKYTGPSANSQWQKAMSWVRENTPKDALFVHWWDYGYWVQTLGKRATVADGGHFQGVYDGNPKIGRYVLTTPYPKTALSFFKTMSTDYLLIDPTDLGKYPAYSKIGGGNDDKGKTWDRYSAIPIMLADSKQTTETANGSMVVFTGGSYLFEDITYKDGDKTVFLPSGKAAIIGIILKIEGNSMKQPKAVYVYNNVQTRIPIRYIYLNGNLMDFGSGLDVVIDIIPSINKNGQINKLGASIYLSQKVSKSLFARLYLMNDTFGEYGTLKVAHAETDPVVSSLRNQGLDIGEFVYYGGFRGPLKIWDVRDIPKNINVVKEFKEPPVYDKNGEFVYGALDDLNFSS